jgi:hypothetical protein
MRRAEDWIKALRLQAHPEGGYFAPSYQSSQHISSDNLPARYQGDRAAATSIYFLVKSENFSAFHRLQSEEMWFFHEGATLCLHLIHGDGTWEKVYLGTKPEAGEVPSFLVPAHTWFAAEVLQADEFCLVSCVVCPGFSFEDFELAERKPLIQQFPAHQALISRLTRIS